MAKGQRALPVAFGSGGVLQRPFPKSLVAVLTGLSFQRGVDVKARFLASVRRRQFLFCQRQKNV